MFHNLKNGLITPAKLSGFSLFCQKRANIYNILTFQG